MPHAVASDFRSIVGQRIENADRLLASRWLDRLKELVPVAPDDIFPGEQLLGPAPTLVRELAAFLQAPAHESIAANGVVTARATELGHLRHAQRASIHQVLREYRTLRSVLTQFIAEAIGELRLTPLPGELIDLMNRLDAAVEVLLETTIDTYIAGYTERRSTSMWRGWSWCSSTCCRMRSSTAIPTSPHASSRSPSCPTVIRVSAR